MNTKRWAILLSATAILLIAYRGRTTPDSPPAAATPSVPRWDKSETKQAERKALIGKLVATGIFSKVVQNGNTYPRAWTGAGFDPLEFDSKQQFLSVVYAYYFDGNESDSVALVDGRSGKEIGRFRPSGLQLN